MYNSPTIELLGDAQMGEVMGAFVFSPVAVVVLVAAVVIVFVFV